MFPSQEEIEKARNLGLPLPSSMKGACMIDVDQIQALYTYDYLHNCGEQISGTGVLLKSGDEWMITEPFDLVATTLAKIGLLN